MMVLKVGFCTLDLLQNLSFSYPDVYLFLAFMLNMIFCNICFCVSNAKRGKKWLEKRSLHQIMKSDISTINLMVIFKCSKLLKVDEEQKI